MKHSIALLLQLFLQPALLLGARFGSLYVKTI